MGRKVLARAGSAVLIWAREQSTPAVGEKISPQPLQFSHRELAKGLDVYAMPDATARRRGPPDDRGAGRQPPSASPSASPVSPPAMAAIWVSSAARASGEQLRAAVPGA